MANERIIGIDFGTSTSVIRVKNYTLGGKPVNEKLDTKSVTFNNGATTVPTLVQKVNDAAYYGYDADVSKKNEEVFRNFKLNLQSADSAEREEAKKLTREFFGYLHKEYAAQSSGGHLGGSGETESTIVSYPVKWSDETRDFMLQAAKDAGFSNVTGMDEAEAAIRAVTVQCEDFLKQKRYLENGKPSNILLIDMGAGTTDLVLCRFTPGEQPKNEILCVWPKGGQVFFGGKEIDELLKTYIAPKIPDMFRENLLKNITLDKFKAWKEETVSPALKRNENVTEFSAADTLLQFMGEELDAFDLNRGEFETYAAEYLNSFPALINGCLENAGISGDDIDLVLATGGHSQWYFVKKFLTGKMNEFDSISLDKIISDPGRIISVTLPQETVALGLVYSKISGSVAENTSAVREHKSTKKIENSTHDAKPEEPKQYTISEIKAYANRHSEVGASDKLYVGNTTPKINEFLGGFRDLKINRDKIILYYDSPFSGCGMLMTDEMLLWKNVQTPPNFVRIKYISHFDRGSAANDALYLCTTSGSRYYLECGFPTSFLNDMLERVKRGAHNCNPDKKNKTPVHDVRREQYTISEIKAYARSHPYNNVYVGDTTPKIDRFLRGFRRLNINRNKIILYYDSTFFGGGKEGVLFTDEWFLWKNLQEDPHYINIKDIAGFDRGSKAPNSLYLYTIRGNEYRLECLLEKMSLLNGILERVKNIKR